MKWLVSKSLILRKIIQKYLYSLQNLSQDWYRGLTEEEEHNKKRVKKKKFQNMSEKDKQRIKVYTKKYNKNRYENMSEEQKQNEKE